MKATEQIAARLDEQSAACRKSLEAANPPVDAGAFIKALDAASNQQFVKALEEIS